MNIPIIFGRTFCFFTSHFNTSDMKNKIHLSLMVLAVLALFSSCAKESISPDAAPEQPVSSAAYLQSLKPAVLFHFSYENQTTGEKYGWFIDKAGNVKSYLNRGPGGSLPEGETCSFQEVRNLYNLAAETHITLTADELAAKARIVGLAATGQLSTRAEDASQEIVSTYVAYREPDVRYGEVGGCNVDPYSTGGGAATLSCDEEVQVVMLQTEGAVQQQNLSPEAVNLTKWLKEIQLSAGL